MTEQERATRQLAAMLTMKGFSVTVGVLTAGTLGRIATIRHPHSRQWEVYEFIRDLGVEGGNINVLEKGASPLVFDGTTWIVPSPMSVGAIADNFSRIHLTTTTV